MKHILIIDDTEENVIFLNDLISELYKTTVVSSISEMIKILNKNNFDLIIINTENHDFEDFDSFMIINPFGIIDSTPIMLLSLTETKTNNLKYLDFNLVDFVSKPFFPELILKKIALNIELSSYRNNLKAIINRKTQTIEHLNDAIFISLAELVEFRDLETGGHIKRTAAYLEILVKAMSHLNKYKEIMTPEYIHDIIRSAPLHDIGKIGISDSILLKNGKFNSEDFEYMKQHTILGGNTIQNVINRTKSCSFLSIAKDMALHHHEKWDGSGYPYGLSKYDIPLCARIMAIADVYDALTSQRRYKEAVSHETAVNIILSCSGTHFDPDIVDVFRDMHIQFFKASKLFKLT